MFYYQKRFILTRRLKQCFYLMLKCALGLLTGTSYSFTEANERCKFNFQKSLVYTLLTCVFTVCFSLTVSGEEGTFMESKGVISRAFLSDGNQERLRMFFSKAEAGESLTVGVLGGSITQGAACSNPESRYHGVLLTWLRKTFPNAQFNLINAGVGSTGSDYGALRAERDLLSRKPDLVILEFGVNDKTRDYAETYEGCVRQILSAPNKPALILLFMMWKDGSNAQEWQSKIGYHYQLPMISYRDALWPEIQAGRIRWTDISPDIVHPNPVGHTFAGEILCAFMEKSLRADKQNISSFHPSVELPSPLFSDLYGNCVLLEGESLQPLVNEGWAFESGQDGTPSGWTSSKPGSVIEFDVPGCMILFSYWRTQKEPMGKATVSIDGGAPVVADGWFSESWGGKRWTLRLLPEQSSDLHRVHIELVQDKNPQSEGHEFKILSIGGAGVNSFN